MKKILNKSSTFSHLINPQINLLDLRKVLDKHWPLLFILSVWVIFSSPYLFQNKTPFPSDYLVNNFTPWSDYKNFWGPVKNSAMPDIVDQIYPWKKFTIENLKNGQIPLWNPYSFSGNIHLANYQSSVLSPFNVLLVLMEIRTAWTFLILLQPLLSGIFVYLFIRSLSLSRPAGLIASISFMFSGFMTVWMGYATLGYAILFLPLSLFAIESYLKSQRKRFAVLLSLTIPLSFFSGHFQISLYFLGFLSAYLGFKTIFTNTKVLPAKLFLFLIFGVLLSMPQILPSVEAYQQAVRSSFFARSEIIPLTHLATIISPDFFGNPVTRNNPIGHYAEWAIFSGTIPFLLAILALFGLRKNNHIIFFTAASAVSVLLSFDTLFSDLIIRVQIPVISTSAISRIIVIFSFCVAILSAFGMDILMKKVKEKNRKDLVKWFVFSLLIISLIIGFAFSPFIDKSTSSVALKNSILPAVLSIILLIGVTASFFNKRLIVLLPFALLFLTSFDMIRFASKWMPQASSENIYKDIPPTKFLEDLPDDGRIVGTPQHINNTYKTYGVDGYDPLYIRRYGEFIAYANSGNLSSPPSKGIKFSYGGEYADQTLNLLGVKYIFHKVSDDEKVWSFPFEKYEKQKFKEVFDDEVIRVYENISSAPRVFLTSDFEVEKDDEKILEKVFKNASPKHIILEKDINLERDTQDGSATIEKYAPNEVVIKTNSGNDSLLYLSDNYYPGWNAYLGKVEDKNRQEILRVNYTFRAVRVPSGENTVIFKYEPKSFTNGVYLAVLGFALITLLSYKSMRAGR